MRFSLFCFVQQFSTENCTFVQSKITHNCIEQSDDTTTKPLIAFFENIISLNSGEKLLVNEYFKPRLYRKRQYVLQQGDMCRCLNFVVRGCLRMYKVDEKVDKLILTGTGIPKPIYP